MNVFLKKIIIKINIIFLEEKLKDLIFMKFFILLLKLDISYKNPSYKYFDISVKDFNMEWESGFTIEDYSIIQIDI